jgi:phosphoglycerol transferase MdoB-like AlkP superfamily enzyme
LTVSAAYPTGPVGWTRSRYGFALFFILSLLLAFLALRATLVFHFRADLHAPTRDIVLAFLAGARRDLFIALVATLPLLLWFVILPDRWFSAAFHRLAFLAGFFLFWAGMVFSLVTEFFFFDEFRSRFNTVAVDYLLYPHEVFINIRESYPVVPLVAACLGASFLWLLIALNRFRAMWDRQFSWLARFAHLAAATALAAALLPTFNLKGERFSQERAINEIANNGQLSFIAAFWTRHLDYGVFYRTLPRTEAYERARHALAATNAQFAPAPDSIQRQVAGDTNRPRLNVILHIQESLGSEFWGSLGRPGDSCTPEMDRLALSEGLLFTNLYASGNRTIRGFEGVLASFPPLPGDSIVARDLSDNVETIARVLRRDGYRTLFLYGGRGIFDGMRSFTLRNGYESFIEQSDFPRPTFTTIWGVCDEDLMARTIAECRLLARTGQPFLATVLSVSNHQPYTYPTGRIAADPNERRRENAVCYADYALGQFFRLARRESFWTNTVFVVVADHGARVYGSQSIPIRSYEIPLVILGPAVVPKPAFIPRLGCSLDVAPTILGLIGRPYQSLFFGRDLLAPDNDPGRVLIHHNRDIGLFSQDRLVVLGLRQGIEFYAGDPKTDQLRKIDQPTPLDLDLEKDATALFQIADDLYIHRRYRIDPN